MGGAPSRAVGCCRVPAAEKRGGAARTSPVELAATPAAASAVALERTGQLPVVDVGGRVGRCNVRVAGSCPFGAFVLRGNNARWEPGCTGERQLNDALRNAAAGSSR